MYPVFKGILKEIVDAIEEVVGICGGNGLLFGFWRGFLGGMVGPADKSNWKWYATSMFTTQVFLSFLDQMSYFFQSFILPLDNFLLLLQKLVIKRGFFHSFLIQVLWFIINVGWFRSLTTIFGLATIGFGYAVCLSLILQFLLLDLLFVMLNGLLEINLYLFFFGALV